MVNVETINTVSIDVYFDYICPYVYNAAVWLQKVKEDMGEKLIVTWKYFSLEQINNQQGTGWKIWEQPEDYSLLGLRAFWAAEAARRQGEIIFQDFHMGLLRAKHEQKRDIADMNTIIEVANNTGLDLNQFQRDIGNRKLLTKLAADHTFAVETFRIFGTPTLVFPEKQIIFLKMSPPPSPKECLPVFKELFKLVCHRRNIREIKRL